ncbi:MAG TPA: HNH endonuclease [Actinomycetales bacterium]|nr:HNH endonuclease [Actinomycetales bacterium]
MAYWWVNQGGTYQHEVPGGYMWSPQRNNNGAYSQYYENMRRVEPGDVVVSYAGGEICAQGIARTTAYEAPKPVEFGAAGDVWADLGWRVDVDFQEIPRPKRVRPKDYKDELLPLAPEKYSPMQKNGNGFTAYLFELPEPFALALLSKIDSTVEQQFAQELVAHGERLQRLGEDRVEAFLRRSALEATEKEALIAARRGQGRFREGVSYVEPECRFTGVRNPALLLASHIKPWFRCHTNGERLDPFNGLMLTPTFDRLFDRGLVTFSSDSRLVVSPSLPRDDIQKIHMDPAMSTPRFRPEQQSYLAYHREHVFRAA